MKNKVISKKELTDMMTELWKDSPIANIGLVPGTTGTYHIGNGMHTGIGGWNMFHKLLSEEAKNYKYDK